MDIPFLILMVLLLLLMGCDRSTEEKSQCISKGGIPVDIGVSPFQIKGIFYDYLCLKPEALIIFEEKNNG